MEKEKYFQQTLLEKPLYPRPEQSFLSLCYTPKLNLKQLLVSNEATKIFKKIPSTKFLCP